MERLKRCSIGEKCEIECHKEKKVGFKDFEQIPMKDLEVLRLRSGIKSLGDCINLR